MSVGLSACAEGLVHLLIQEHGDYHDHYVYTDVLLLADVIKNFFPICLDVYSLDPTHYYSSPRPSWCVLLKYTGMELELLTDVDMNLFMDKGM